MKKILLFVAFFCLLSQNAFPNCAIDKKDEFDALVKELREYDVDLALEAKKAFGIVSSYEAFGKDEKCTHMDRLLSNMKDVLDTQK